MSEKKGGLCIALEEDIPTLIVVNGKVVAELYQLIAEKGYKRTRIVAGKDVRIYGPSRVRKGWTDGIEVGGISEKVN